MDYGAVLPPSLMVFFAINVIKILLPGRNCKIGKIGKIHVVAKQIFSYLDSLARYVVGKNYLVIWIIKCISLAGWALKCRFMSAIIGSY